MEEGLTLSQREQRRLQVLNRVLQGLSMAEASRLLGVSERHGWRLLAAYRREGAAALAHGNRGRKPVHTIAEEVKARVRSLVEGKYAGFNHSHLTEKLCEPEGIQLSRSTVRRILKEAGLRSPRKRRAPKHRSRRERYPQEGMLLQVDGSRHKWLEDRGPWLTLLGAIDDATGTVHALFREQEDAHGYFLLLEEIIKSKGIPLALYSDRHSIFQRSPSEQESLEEQLMGKEEPTQFGRALLELGIEAIFALSPQAKGRIERLWNTFQDRLVSELRLAGVSTLEEANRVLEWFLPQFNKNFAVPPSQEGSAYRGLDKTLSLKGVLCFKYLRTVAGDNTVRFGGDALQLLPGLDRLSYVHAQVEVQERLDGSLAVIYQGRTIATRKAPLDAPTLRARNSKRSSGPISPAPAASGPDLLVKNVIGRYGRKPAPNHPWRKSILTKSLNN
jgi:transposase